MNIWMKICSMLTVLVVFTAGISMSSAAFAYVENEAVGEMLFEDKTPLEYTLEEYEMLTPQQQDEFFLWFESIEAFEAWMARVEPLMPWELENRKPAEYSWDEYNELSNEQQEAFVVAFESVEAFEGWMENSRPDEVVIMPWDEKGKKPSAYTWQEYESLMPRQQNAFIEWFADEGDFEAWMESAKAESADSAVIDWEEATKKPDSYTWIEYEALTIEQKDSFAEWFDDIYAFETWMEDAQSEAFEASKEMFMPWEAEEKAPNMYTWTDFEALTVEQQDAFVEWFGSPEAFEVWMEAVNPSMRVELIIPWANDKKQPDMYTVAEFKELTAYQQSRFFVWFEKTEKFDHWLNTVSMINHEELMSWNVVEENTGIQENSEDMAEEDETKKFYALRSCTWSEYEQMTSEQRILFFKSFDSVDSFKLWLEMSKPDDMLAVLMPWDNTKKQPEDYTWEEYEALPVELQDAFFAWFESAELFEEWMKQAASQDVLRMFGVIEPIIDTSAE